ncbi:MAG TPA: hypothetical protein VD997_16505 [Phycisphaerales bacterium]|nr:hypothetical protein [Phycisphaerales bacterium]
MGLNVCGAAAADRRACVRDRAQDGGGAAAGFDVVVFELLRWVGRGCEQAGERFESLGFHARKRELAMGEDVGRDLGAGGEGDDVEGG